ncbi:MAG: dihydroorotate dehydrogenase [Chloroflexi bacterium]|nr:dihydroorotate dehydrogenase [Chloroflexota bacterium]
MTSVELAPLSKTGLRLPSPLMTAVGCFGPHIDYHGLADVESLGAVVIGPLTARPRRGASPPRAVRVPGGVLLHSGLANPGIAASVRQYGRAWRRSAVPVIAHVATIDVHDTTTCCERLNDVPGIAGVELGFADSTTIEEMDDFIAAARVCCTLPLIARLPLFRAQEICTLIAACGVDAFTVAAPPRGSAWDPSSGRLITGRLYGHFVQPLALHAVHAVLDQVTVPVIGCGGIFETQDALDLLRAGAAAVQVDAAVWHSPWSVSEIARGVAAATG